MAAPSANFRPDADRRRRIEPKFVARLHHSRGCQIALLTLLSLQSAPPERFLPRLAAEATVTLEACWEPCRRSKYGLFDQTEALRTVHPAEVRHAYSADVLAPFLPSGPVAVGETWPVSREAVIPFLRQFHPGARSELHSTDDEGAFALLRAVSTDRIEILFRAHAEFQLTPDVVYTPAQFEGRLSIERASSLPLALTIVLPDRDTNVVVNVSTGVSPSDRFRDADGQLLTLERVTSADIGWVPRMALATPDVAPVAEWSSSISDAEARLRLARCFYPFAGLDWLSFGAALSHAHELDRPVLVVVLFGTLDDESR